MQGFDYEVDLVLCIDSTASMTPILDSVKTTALGFHERVTSALAAKDKHLTRLWVRVVAFRDVVDNGSAGLLCSPFFDLPRDSDQFSTFVREIRPMGNTTYPESGLVSLAVAMHSDWHRQSHRKRHVIVIWTDDEPNPLETDGPAVPAPYSSMVPMNLDELTEMWDGQSSIMQPTAKRLLIFAPDGGVWTELAESWQSTIHFPSKAGMGLADQEYSTMIDLIANSI